MHWPKLAMGFLALATGAAPAMGAGTYDTGASDTAIKIGQTFPYSGPASGVAPLARGIAAYFVALNDQGGINGRKIDFVSLDDGYSPPKTVEQTRRLVEEEGVLLMFASLGTPTNEAVRPYLNQRKVPQLFVITGANGVVDPKHYPWTMGWIPSYALESRIFAKYLLAQKPNARIGILYQDDDFGRDHLDPFLAALGDRAAKMVVAKASYQVTDPTLTSQIISLRSAGADTLYLIAQGRAAPQSVAAVHAQGDWKPIVLLPSVSTSKGIIGPAGVEALTGVISAGYEKDPTDPARKDDPAVQVYLKWMRTYAPQGDWENDESSPAGYDVAQALAEVLRRCGDGLTRANVMKQAAGLQGLTLPMLLPGITVNTAPDNYAPIDTLQIERFDGVRWVPVGAPVKG